MLTVGRLWSRLQVSFEHVTVLLEGIEGTSILEHVLILHDDVEDDKTGGTRCEIHTAFIVLILAEKQLCVLRVMQALEQETSHQHAHFLTILEGKPVAHELSNVE